MADGRILVGGGHGQEGPADSSVSVYDPVEDLWSSLNNMMFTRVEHIYSLLPDGRVVVTGGRNLTGAIGDVEFYDPVNDKWSLAGGPK